LPGPDWPGPVKSNVRQRNRWPKSLVTMGSHVRDECELPCTKMAGRWPGRPLSVQAIRWPAISTCR
jgi:hypothetical protein